MQTIGPAYGVKRTNNKELKDQFEGATVHFVFFFFMEVTFIFLFAGMLSYFEYINMRVKNQIVLCQENFEVIVNNLNNAIISKSIDGHFGYCNQLGLDIIKSIQSH